MQLQILSEATAQVLAVLLAIAGSVQVLGIGVVRRACSRWGYPGLYKTTGALELLAAVLLAIPQTRLAGILLAAAVNFSVVVLLLKSRAWIVALPGVAVAAALLLTLAQFRF